MKKRNVKALTAVILASTYLTSGMVANAVEPETMPDTPPATIMPSAEESVPTEAEAAVFTQAMLDAYIRLDPTAASALGYLSAQEWAEEFSTAWQAVLAQFSSFPISDEAMNEVLNATMNMMSRANYMAGATQRLEDGSYAVTITYSKMHMFEGFWERYQEALFTLDIDLSEMSEEDLFSRAVIMVSDLFNQSCENAVYSEPATTTIIVTYSDGKLTISNETIDTLSDLLFDLDIME